ncbi:MAG: hypothetical protein ABW223_10905, partial [Rariglobus sp.]
MKFPKLAALASVAFVVSFFLPAFAGAKGYQCFEFCWKLLLGHQSQTVDPFGRIYYSAFVVSNLAFVVLVGLAIVKAGYTKTRFVASAVIFFHVLSWLFLNLAKETVETLQLQPGYYLWLAAYALLVAAHFVPIPPNPALVEPLET